MDGEKDVFETRPGDSFKDFILSDTCAIGFTVLLTMNIEDFVELHTNTTPYKQHQDILKDWNIKCTFAEVRNDLKKGHTLRTSVMNWCEKRTHKMTKVEKTQFAKFVASPGSVIDSSIMRYLFGYIDQYPSLCDYKYEWLHSSTRSSKVSEVPIKKSTNLFLSSDSSSSDGRTDSHLSPLGTICF